MSGFRAIADRVEIAALRGEFTGGDDARRRPPPPGCPQQPETQLNRRSQRTKGALDGRSL